MFFSKKSKNIFLDNSYDPNYFEEYEEIESLEYNHKSSLLKFQIVRHTLTPKITRYVQRNYERTPIYGDLSHRTKIIKNFSKAILIEKFLEEELFNIQINEDHKIEITQFLISELDLGFLPSWYEKILKLEKLDEEKELTIEKYDNKINSLEKELNNLEIENEFDKNRFNKLIKKRTKPHSKNYLILSIIFSFLLFGLIMLINYTSEKDAEFNIEQIKKYEKILKIEEKEINKLKNKIEKIIIEKEIQVNNLLNKINKTEKSSPKRKVTINSDGWIDLRQELKYSH